MCNKDVLVRRDTYNANVKRNGQYLCHHCSTIKAGKEGKYSNTFDARSQQSKKLWQSHEFRTKITEASLKNNTTIEYRENQRCRSELLWNDPEYKKAVSAGVSKAMESILLRKRISQALCDKYLSDPTYRKAVGDAAKLRFQDDEYRKKMAIIRSNQPRISSIQRKLYKFLDDIGVEYYEEGKETAIGWYCFDCLVPRGNGGILIECQGNYWHSIPGAERKDKAKFTYINKYFPEYEIMYVWEHEFDTDGRVLDRLKNKLNVDIETIDFDFKDVVLSEDLNVREFLDAYHYIGGNKGGRSITATLSDEIIACALFSKPLRQNMKYNGAVELSRFCIHPSYHKKNFASWFISRAVKRINKTVVAYADTTVGHTGGIYRASNFQFSHEVLPDYWYVDHDGYVMHKKTLYNRAVNLKMKESEFAEKYGYSKKYGGFKLCFIKQK